MLRFNSAVRPAGSWRAQSPGDFPDESLGTWDSPVEVATISLADAPSTCTGTSQRVCTYTDQNAPSFGTASYQVRAYQGSSSNQSPNSNTATGFQIQWSTSQCVEDHSGNTQCGPAVAFAASPRERGNAIIGRFEPDLVLTVEAVAQVLQYDHFNWISVVNHDNAGVWYDIAGSALPIPHFDPAPGGYGSPESLPADRLPYYYDEISGFGLDHFIFNPAYAGDPYTSSTIVFTDLPYDSRIPAGDYIGFFTTLVGVKTVVGADPNITPPNYTPLVSLAWCTRDNGSNGTTVGRLSNFDAPLDLGIGGIFNASIVANEDLPPLIRQLLIQSGAQGVPTTPYVDTSQPMTAGFPSGPLGTNGWYTGPVTVTLIATDIDGPSDVAATYYTIDDGGSETYGGPFVIPNDGIHQLSSYSVDKAGNVETPRPSQSFMIDATPPSIVPQITGTLGNNGWYVSNVMVTWSVTDSVSGTASSTGCSPTSLTTSSAGTKLTCSAVSGAGLASSVSVTVKIDLTPPKLTLPANMTVYAASSKGAPVTYNVTASDLVNPNPVIVCQPASKSTFPLGTTLVNCTATASSGNQSSASFDIVVIGPDDLAIGSLTSPLVRTGQNLTYFIGALNLGPATGDQVTVRDSLPLGTTLVRASWVEGSCTVGGLYNCPTPSPRLPCSLSAGTVICGIGTLAPFTLRNPSGAGILLVVKVTAPAGSTIKNTAMVSGANVDTHPGDNSFSVATKVVK